MAKGYVIFDEKIHDQAGYDAYVGKALPTIMQQGGRAIVVHDNPEVIEGEWFGSRVVVLGGVPYWRRGLNNEVMRQYMLRKSLIPARLAAGVAFDSGYDDLLRERLAPLGAEFISVRDVLCNAEGCLTRLGDSAADIVAIDQVHLSEKGSEFLIGAIIDRVLTPPSGDRK